MSRKKEAQQRKKGRTILVRPLVSAYMLKNVDKPFSEEAIELAESILRRNDDTHRRGKFSPSQGDDCIRASLIQWNGYKSKAPDRFAMVNRFQDGNYGHLIWQMTMFDMGILERAEFAVSVKKWGVQGTCDGILAVPDFTKVEGGYDPRMSRQDVRDIIESGDVSVTRLVAEIKRANDFRWSMMSGRNEPEVKIVWQGSLYYHGAKEVLPKKEADRLKGVCYWIENKNDNNIIEFDLAPTAQGTAAFDKFYGRAVRLAARGKLPERPFVRDSKECRGCWVSKHCDSFEDKGKKRLSPPKGVKLGDFAAEVIANAA